MGYIVLISKIPLSFPSGTPLFCNRNPSSASSCSYISCHFLICSQYSSLKDHPVQPALFLCQWHSELYVITKFQQCVSLPRSACIHVLCNISLKDSRNESYAELAPQDDCLVWLDSLVKCHLLQLFHTCSPVKIRCKHVLSSFINAIWIPLLWPK